MSHKTPGDDIRCDHCDRPGVPYEYRGLQFSGLTANRGERLCPRCLGFALDAESATRPDPGITCISPKGARAASIRKRKV